VPVWQQQGSTATDLDAGGRAGTRGDGDLRRYTRVDVLPLDGTQEVRSSKVKSRDVVFRG